MRVSRGRDWRDHLVLRSPYVPEDLREEVPHDTARRGVIHLADSLTAAKKVVYVYGRKSDVIGVWLQTCLGKL